MYTVGLKTLGVLSQCPRIDDAIYIQLYIHTVCTTVKDCERHRCDNHNGALLEHTSHLDNFFG